MRRFTTAVVANASHQTLAKSAMRLGLRTAWISASDFRGLPLETRVAKLEADLNAVVIDLNDKIFEIAEFETCNQALRDEAFSRASEEEKQTVEATFDQLEQAIAVDRKLVPLARAFELIGKDFKRRFNTSYSLLFIWGIPGRVCDDEAKTALQSFFDANEQWLPKPLRMKFFSVWKSVSERFDGVVTHPKGDVLALERDDVILAFDVWRDVCDESFDQDVCASILEAITRLIERENMQKEKTSTDVDRTAMDVGIETSPSRD